MFAPPPSKISGYAPESRLGSLGFLPTKYTGVVNGYLFVAHIVAQIIRAQLALAPPPLPF